MDGIKEKIRKTIEQINLIKDIQKDDKIYIYNEIMYFHNPSMYQILYRTLTGESREYTFKYLENFIAMYVNLDKTITKYYRLLDHVLIKEYRTSKQHIVNILTVLQQTYPDNQWQLNNLLLFLTESL